MPCLYGGMRSVPSSKSGSNQKMLPSRCQAVTSSPMLGIQSTTGRPRSQVTVAMARPCPGTRLEHCVISINNVVTTQSVSVALCGRSDFARGDDDVRRSLHESATRVKSNPHEGVKPATVSWPSPRNVAKALHNRGNRLVLLAVKPPSFDWTGGQASVGRGCLGSIAIAKGWTGSRPQRAEVFSGHRWTWSPGKRRQCRRWGCACAPSRR
jgi:hypothetical protein